MCCRLIVQSSFFRKWPIFIFNGQKIMAKKLEASALSKNIQNSSYTDIQIFLLLNGQIPVDPVVPVSHFETDDYYIDIARNP